MIRCAPPDPAPRPPRSPVPAGACDCHFHIFDGPSTLDPGRSYDPSDAPAQDYARMQRVLGLDRAVIVQPSIYGTDNRTTMQACAGDDTRRAVVVVDDTAPLSELRGLADQGAVGARVNLMFSSGAQLADLHGFARRLADLGWHLQILADLSDFADLDGLLQDLPVPVVVDHMGHIPASQGVGDPGFQQLLRAMDTGRVWVKLSGAYRIASGDFAAAAPMARALVAANPQRLVWGSDWPHPAITGPMPNDGALLDLLFDWADPATAAQILVDNPQRLYGFPRWQDTE